MRAHRSITEAIQGPITALAAARINYVVADRFAYGFYAPPRFVTSVALLVHEGERLPATHALTASGLYQTGQLQFRDRETELEFNLQLAMLDPELSALKDPARHDLLGLPMLVIKPEHLLWIYCLSDLLSHFAEAIELVKAGQVDIGKFVRFLHRAGHTAARGQLQRVLKHALAEQHSSYSRSVASRRLRSRRLLR